MGPIMGVHAGEKQMGNEVPASEGQGGATGQMVRGGYHVASAMRSAWEDPLDCHRGLMIAPALVERGLAPLHLRADGRVESTAEMEGRLLAETKVGVGILDGLFAGSLGRKERQDL